MPALFEEPEQPPIRFLRLSTLPRQASDFRPARALVRLNDGIALLCRMPMAMLTASFDKPVRSANAPMLLQYHLPIVGAPKN
jgi:hypothetical protein